MAIDRPMQGRTGTAKNVRVSSSDAHAAMAAKYRLKIGQFVRQLRVGAQMTQTEMGQVIGGVCHTQVSSIENGRNSLPPEQYDALVQHFGLNREEFGEFILRYTNPWLYGLIYGTDYDRSLSRDLSHTPHRIGESQH